MYFRILYYQLEEILYDDHQVTVNYYKRMIIYIMNINKYILVGQNRIYQKYFQG